MNLADSKDQIYSKANVLLNLLEKLFSGKNLIFFKNKKKNNKIGDDLVGALYKSLESTTKIKVKICSLEAMMLVIKKYLKNLNFFSQIIIFSKFYIFVFCVLTFIIFH